MSNYAAAKGIYEQGLANVKTRPVPAGQKFPPGTRVKIADVLDSDMSHFEAGVEATVEYTYAHAYGGKDVKSYSLCFDDGNSVAWYREHQLSKVE